jgi:hypothetical protein
MPPSQRESRIQLSKLLRSLPQGTDTDSDKVPEFELADASISTANGNLTSLLLASEKNVLTITGRLRYTSSLSKQCMILCHSMSRSS